MTGPTVDIAGAARATGLSVKAIRGRVERGSLPHELVGGRRRIPIRALLEAGLLVEDAGTRRAPQSDPVAEELRALREEVSRLADEVARLRQDDRLSR
jgi:uncharacterized protein (UPF0335 family)